MNCGIDKQVLSILVSLCENGVNPESLAAVVKELKSEAEALQVGACLNLEFHQRRKQIDIKGYSCQKRLDCKIRIKLILNNYGQSDISERLVFFSYLEEASNNRERSIRGQTSRFVIFPVASYEERWNRPISFYYYENNRICKKDRENIDLEEVFQVK